MTKEELMKPRFKVIADYPNSSNKIGDVIELPNKEWKYADEVNCLEDYFLDYPIVFKKLEWWEQRDENDMPEYVKLFFDDKIHYVHRVEKWIGENLNCQPLYEYYNKANYLTIACVCNLNPATKEEYEAYINQQSK